MSGLGLATFILLGGPALEHSFLVAVGPDPVFISRVAAHVARPRPLLVFTLLQTSCFHIDHMNSLPGLFVGKAGLV